MKPENVDLRLGLCSTFGKSEVETAACYLVRFLQQRKKGWASFTLQDYTNFLNSCKPVVSLETGLFGLLGDWYDDGPMEIQQGQWLTNLGDTISIRLEFVARLEKHKYKSKRKTVLRGELAGLALINSKKLPHLIEIDGVRKRWVGIDWVMEGKPTGRETLVID